MYNHYNRNETEKKMNSINLSTFHKISGSNFKKKITKIKFHL